MSSILSVSRSHELVEPLLHPDNKDHDLRTYSRNAQQIIHADSINNNLNHPPLPQTQTQFLSLETIIRIEFQTYLSLYAWQNSMQ